MDDVITIGKDCFMYIHKLSLQLNLLKKSANIWTAGQIRIMLYAKKIV